jgi:hypothetical protein
MINFFLRSDQHLIDFFFWFTKNPIKYFIKKGPLILPSFNESLYVMQCLQAMI